jgi:protein gp37
MKYKNKDGISLNYTSDDVHTNLVKEVIIETIKILKDIPQNAYSMGSSTTTEAIDFLIENFDLKTTEDYIDE